MNSPPWVESRMCLYGRMKALTWAFSGLGSPDVVESSTGKGLSALLPNLRKPLVLDCSGMSTLEDHAFESLGGILPSIDVPLLFTNCIAGFASDLERALGAPAVTELPTSGDEQGSVSRVLSFGKNPLEPKTVQKVVAEGFTAEQRTIKAIIGNTFEKNRGGRYQRLHSTPLLASGYFNSRRLVSKSADFVIVCCALNSRFEALLQRLTPPNPALLAVSMHGAPFAAAVSQLTSPHVDVEIVDHSGPRHVVNEEYRGDDPYLPVQYIFVSDFVIGGTELRIAVNYAHAKGSIIAHTFAIGSLLEPTEYHCGIAIEPLAALRECCAEATYKFIEEAGQ